MFSTNWCPILSLDCGWEDSLLFFAVTQWFEIMHLDELAKIGILWVSSICPLYESDVYDCHFLFMKSFPITLSGAATDQEPGCRQEPFHKCWRWAWGLTESFPWPESAMPGMSAGIRFPSVLMEDIINFSQNSFWVWTWLQDFFFLSQCSTSFSSHSLNGAVPPGEIYLPSLVNEAFKNCNP